MVVLQTIAVSENAKPGLKLKKLTLNRETIQSLGREGLQKDAADKLWASDPFFGCSQVYC